MPELILLIIIYPMLFILYFINKHSITNGTNLYFGITLPDELLHDSRFLELKEEHSKKLLRTTILSAFFSFLIIIIPNYSFSMTLLYLWIFVTLAAYKNPFAQANIKLQELKVKNLMRPNTLDESTWNQEPIPPVKQKNYRFTYAIFLLATFSPILYTLINFHERRNFKSLLIALIAIGSLNLLILWVSIKTNRKKVLFLSSNPQINIELDAAKKRIWRCGWFILALTNTAYLNLVFCFFTHFMMNYQFFLLFTYMHITLAIYILVKCLKMIRKLQSQMLHQDLKSEAYHDEDNLWMWGLYYYNSEDKRVVVRKRCNTSLCINQARFLGQIIIHGAILLWLSMLFLCIWSIFMRFTPIHLSLNENQIVATQLRDEYTIDLDSIDSIQLLDESPIQPMKDHSHHIIKGTMQLDNYGLCTLFMMTTNTYFIHLTTDTDTYILSCCHDEWTLELYEQLLDISN